MECVSNTCDIADLGGFFTYKLLPAKLSSYSGQVGGFNPNKKRKFKFLYDQEDSTLYKFVIHPPKGFNEVRLYEEVFSPDCPHSALGLRRFLPAYRGLFYSPMTSKFFIGMEDILKDMAHPNVCDIKVGRLSYLPGDSEDKIIREKAKYLWRDKLGFFITGMKVYDSESRSNSFYDISYGRSLEPSNVFEKGICIFLGRDPRRRALLAQAFLPHLSQLASWFESQTQYHFCASSLLLAYDWPPSEDTNPVAAVSSPSPSSSSSSSSKVHVRLIDFARWRRVGLDGQYDTNFLYGLHRLMQYMRMAASASFSSREHSIPAAISSSSTNAAAAAATSCSLQAQQQSNSLVISRAHGGGGVSGGGGSSSGCRVSSTLRPHSSNSSNESVTFQV